MQIIELPEDQALVLQQVCEAGEEDLSMLSESLRFDRRRLSHIVQALHHKGLIYFNRKNYQNPWIRVSAKGRKFMTYMWPDQQFNPAY